MFCLLNVLLLLLLSCFVFCGKFVRRSSILLSTGRKDMFYLTMHSTHFIYGYMVSAYGDGPLS